MSIITQLTLQIEVKLKMFPKIQSIIWKKKTHDDGIIGFGDKIPCKCNTTFINMDFKYHKNWSREFFFTAVKTRKSRENTSYTNFTQRLI